MSKNYKSRSIRGKLKVYQLLYGNKHLREYLPVTVSYSKTNLQYMLEQFDMVYVKPNYGTHGKGIFRISRVDDQFEVRSSDTTQQFSTIASLHQYLISNFTRPMLIQQGIQLEKINGRAYDIRAMVQRKPGENWTTTGIFTKVGQPNKIVTNYFQGGQIVLLETVFEKLNLDEEEKEKRLKQLNQISIEVARHLSSKQKNMHEMGIDIAYDTKGKFWILEVNSNRPQFYPLKKIDYPMFKRMLTFAKSYGRPNAY